MNIQKYAKKDIAAGQIETALRLFFEKGDLFSVITLAGAAEEILGQLLQERRAPGWRGSFGSVLDTLRPGNRKGAHRERSSGHETDVYVHMDPHREALFLLGRAIDDYQELTGALSAEMLRFDREVRSKESAT